MPGCSARTDTTSGGPVNEALFTPAKDAHDAVFLGEAHLRARSNHPEDAWHG